MPTPTKLDISAFTTPAPLVCPDCTMPHSGLFGNANSRPKYPKAGQLEGPSRDFGIGEPAADAGETGVGLSVPLHEAAGGVID